jgi:sec-independent protein translocase protein TatB
MVIMLLALIVLGPAKLPEAARTVGRFTAEVRRMSNGFRSEVKQAFDAAEETEARAKGDALVAASSEPEAVSTEPGAVVADVPEPDATASDVPEPEPVPPAEPGDEP